MSAFKGCCLIPAASNLVVMRPLSHSPEITPVRVAEAVVKLWRAEPAAVIAPRPLAANAAETGQNWPEWSATATTIPVRERARASLVGRHHICACGLCSVCDSQHTVRPGLQGPSPSPTPPMQPEFSPKSRQRRKSTDALEVR